MTGARLGKYSLWQFRDFAIERGLAILIIGALWGFVSLEPAHRGMGPQWRGDQTSPFWVIALQLAATIVSLSVLIALNGITSTDRKSGYYRFIFSKPVSPVLYYAQLFFVHMAGVLLSMAILAAGMRVLFPVFSIKWFVVYTAIIYIAMGGIGFFLSVATRYDWLTLAAVWLGSRILRAVYGIGDDWRSKAVQLLPPVHRLDQVANSLIERGTAPAGDVVWLLGYGLVFFVVGLVILRKGSLAD